MDGQIIFDLFVIIAVFEMLFLAVELDFGDYNKSIVVFIKSFFKNRNLFGHILSLIVVILLSPGLVILSVGYTILELIIRIFSALWKAGDKK